MALTRTVALTFLVLLPVPGRALDNGLARTPPMGYNTWYDLTGAFNLEKLKETVDAFVDLDLKSYGYNYWNLDDLWSGGRYPNGTIYADRSKLPSGTLRPLADYVHSKGLLFGAYTDRGVKQCGPGPGSEGHEAIDAQTFADWQIDYLKEDSCSAPGDSATAFKQYGLMRDALNKTGRKIVFSLCGWHEWYAPQGQSLGNLWRIGPDDTNWHGILTNININAPLSQYAGPGGWNDPCLLLAEDLNGRQRITELQSRAQFSMWAVMASPLIISANIRNMSRTNIATYTNKEVIAVNQDPLGIQGTRVFGADLRAGGGLGTGTPIVALPCDASDPQQEWLGGDLNNKTPNGTLWHTASNMALDVFDCKTQLVLWPWVTNGCQGNRGFYFEPIDNALKSTLDTPLCVQDNGEAKALSLSACDPTSPATQRVHYDSATKRIRLGTGRCAGVSSSSSNAVNVWARPLTGGRVAFVFINVGPQLVDVTCDADCLKSTAVYGKQVSVRDLWSHSPVPDAASDNLQKLVCKGVAPNGGSAMWVVTPSKV